MLDSKIYSKQHKYIAVKCNKMPKIVLIDKSGTVKTLSVKDFTDETLYKKAGIKSGDGFKLQHAWNVEDGIDQSIKLYGKTNGRAGQENKYDFPPPVDEILFYGSCILIGTDPNTEVVIDLEKDDWEEIYEYLFGGFEDIGTDDSSDGEDMDTDDELDAIQKTTGTVIKQTKQGYAKDGFIVDDEEEYDSDYDDESKKSCDTPPKKIFTKSKKNAISKNRPRETVAKSSSSTSITNNGASSFANSNINDKVEPELNADDCESELSEEPYE
jgi:hypothetical protein